MTDTSGSNALIKELTSLLKKGNAHVTFNEAIKNIPFEDLGKITGNLPYSLWQITEHIRITQKDILDFSVNKNYKELNWPDDYWPKDAAPKNEEAWKKCIQSIDNDLNNFIELLNTSEDIFTPFKHGKGQNLLREAMLMADHTSYHTGEIIIVRRLLGNWKK
ncbi:MAG: DinB family protein [Parafilimonas sp.]